MRRSPEGDGGEAGPRQPGRGRVSRPGSRRCPRGPGCSRGPIQGGLTVLAGGVPVQAWRKHLRVPTGVGTAGGDRVGPQLRSTLAAWGGGSGPDGRSPPQPRKGRRGRGGAGRTHPAGDLGSRECALRPCTSGRETPRDEPRKGGRHLPRDPRPSPHLYGPAPNKAPPMQAPPRPPPQGVPPGRARPRPPPPRSSSAPPASFPGWVWPHPVGVAAGWELPSFVRPSLPLQLQRLLVPVPRPPQLPPPPPPPLGGHCPFKSLPPPPRPPGAPP